jgi:hypothetical protein
LSHETHPERVALIHRALRAYADTERRAMLAPLEARVVARYLRRECARLDIGVPDYLRDW